MYAITHNGKHYTPDGPDTPPAPVVCDSCGATCTPKNFFNAGYAKIGDRRVCLDCATGLELEQMRQTGAATLYFTPDPKAIGYGHGRITNWHGALDFPCTYRVGHHNFPNCRRVDAWFKAPDGHIWHGYHVDSGYTQLIHCRRTKRQWR